MRLSKYIHNSISLSLDIKGPFVFLLLGLQLAVWYPTISKQNNNLEKSLLMQDRVNAAWQRTHNQAVGIRDIHFSKLPWVQHRVLTSINNLPMQWQIEGTATILEWQHLQETVQKQFALTLHSAVWERKHNGQWYGQLEMGMAHPLENRAHQNWLPVGLRNDNFHPSDWYILSTMQTGEHASALISYQKNSHWVSAGVWLPQAGVTVQNVTPREVTLLTTDGTEQIVKIRALRGTND